MQGSHASLICSRGVFAMAAAVFALMDSSAASAQSGTQNATPPKALRTVRNPTRTLLPDGRTLVLGLQEKASQPAAYVVAPDTLERTSLAAPASVARVGHTATVLPNGRVLIWGGLDGKDQLESRGEWFDPATSVFSDAEDIRLLPRAGHAATVLTDGRLLITGGWNPRFKALSEAELWDYRTNQSELLKGELIPPRIGHSATLLNDGRVLILGGYDENGRRYTDASLYEPDRVAFVAVDSATGASLAASSDTSGVPAVSGSIPSPDIENFQPDGLIALRFSVEMDVRSFEGAVTIMGREGAVSLKTVAAEGGRLLFVQPINELYPGSHYTFFVDGARSTLGQALPFTTIGFSTAILSRTVASEGQDVASPTQTDSTASSPASDNASSNISSTDGSEQPTSATSDSNEVHLSTGLGLSKTRPGCSASAPMKQFCRSAWSATDGFWLPGENTKDGHWRINGVGPTLPEARLLKKRPVPAGATAIYGQVFRIDDTPVAGVEVSIGQTKTRTDDEGVFVLVGTASGHQTMVVDGTTASHGDVEYGDFVVGVDVENGKATAMPHLMYLPRIHPQDKVSIPSPTIKDTVITHPEMPGLEIHIPAGTVLKDRKGRAVTELAIVPTPVDRAPFPTSSNFPIYFVVEPGGIVIQGLSANAAKGVRVVYPNMTRESPGKAADLSVYEPEHGWQRYGGAKISSDGRQVVPDDGVGLHLAMGASYGIYAGKKYPDVGPPQCDSCKCAPGPPTPPPPGGQGQSTCIGDPVDLSTGLFIHRSTDFSISDVLPLSITRTYRQGDTQIRPFGVGTSFNFGLYLYTDSGSQVIYTTFYVVLPDGSKITYTLASGQPGLDGSVWKPVGPAGLFEGSEIRYERTTINGDESFVLERRDGFQYVFDSHFTTMNRLVGMQDRFGNLIRFFYNSGYPVRAQSPSGRYLDFTYDSQNRIKQITDNSGRTVLYTYTSMTAAGLLDTATYPDTTTEHYTYDPTTQNMLTVVDRRGNTEVTNTYDANGRVYQQQLADGATYTFTYTSPLVPTGYLASAHVVEPRGNQRDVTFDITGYPATDTRASGSSIQQTTTYERDARGRITAIVDPMSRRTEYTYDTAGNRNSVTYLAGTPGATTYSMSYTADYNQIQVVTDPLSHSTTYDYTNGCLTKVTDALQHHTDILCNAAGQPTTVTDALGHPTTYGYQGYDLHTITDALNRTLTITTDSLGRVVALQDPLGNLGRLEYDLNDRKNKLIDPLNNTTLLTYDGNGNPLTVTDPNTGLTQFGYDARNRLTSRTDALAHGESWTYDEMSNLLTHTDRKGQLTQFNVVPYDALNRLKQVNYADGSTTALTWDAGDRVSPIIDSLSGTITRSYDDLNRLLSEQTTQGLVSYTYDAASRRATMTPAAQTQIVYTFDDANRLHQIVQGTETVTVDYDSSGRRQMLTLPNGIGVGYVFDNANELTNLTYKDSSGTTIGTLVYGYDAAGHRINQTGTWASDVLPAATSANGVFNLANQQTSFNGVTLSYDLNGNLTSDGTYTYTWDARDRLTTIKQGLVTKGSFTYDAVGRRSSKVVNGATTISFLYDHWNPVQEAQGSSTRPILVGLETDEYFARTETAGRRYFLADALGSTLALADSSQAIQQTYRYEPHGEITAIGSSDNPYQYTGRENDGTGLYYYRARYYSPSRKSFISEDPIGLRAGLNTYAYAHNSPLQRRDSLGLDDTVCMFAPWMCGPGPEPPSPPLQCPEPNGNLSPGYQRQDGVCSSGAAIFNGSPIQGCCFAHDVCYAQNKCNSSSWGGPLSSPCQQCNMTAVSCIVPWFNGPPPGTLGRPPPTPPDPPSIQQHEKQ